MRSKRSLLEELFRLGQLMDHSIPSLVARKHGPGGWQAVVDGMTTDELIPFGSPCVLSDLVSELRLNLGVLHAMCGGRTFRELLDDEIGRYSPTSEVWDWEGWLHGDISLHLITEVVITFGSDDVARTAIEYFAKRLLDQQQLAQATYEPHTIGAAVSRLIVFSGALQNPQVWLFSLKEHAVTNCRTFLRCAQERLDRRSDMEREAAFLRAYDAYLLDAHCSE